MWMKLAHFETLVRKTRLLSLTHNYTDYPMVKEARELVRNGELGEILELVTEYPQGWFIKPIVAQIVQLSKKLAGLRLVRRKQNSTLEPLAN